MCVCLSVPLHFQSLKVSLVLVHVFPLFDFVSIPWELIYPMSVFENVTSGGAGVARVQWYCTIELGKQNKMLTWQTNDSFYPGPNGNKLASANSSA